MLPCPASVAAVSLPIIQSQKQAPCLDSVLLIEPMNGYYAGFHGLAQTEPLGLEFVAGAVTDMVREVRIHDDRIEPGDWRQLIAASAPDLVGVACQYTADVGIVRALVRDVRAMVGPDVPIIVGGHHIGLRPEDMFIPEVTAIVCGPGEEPFQDVVRAWGTRRSLEDVRSIWYQDSSGRFISNVEPFKISPRFRYNAPAMNERPQPRRDLVARFRDGYYFYYYPRVYSVETARGCRYRCSFCSVWQHHRGEFEVQSPDRTVADLASLPPSYVLFVDDLAFSDIDGTNDMVDEILRLELKHRYWAQIRADNVWPRSVEKRPKHQATFAKLAEAGLDMTLIGLESFDPKELKRVNKGSTAEQNIRAIEILHSLGVRIWGAQIVFPEWDVEDFDRTIEINQQLQIDVPQFTILTPLPGTPDYERALKERALRTLEPGMFDFFHSPFPTKLPLEKFYSEISRMYKETGWWARSPSGEFINRGVAIRSTECMMRDLAEGRTNRAAIQRLGQNFENLQNEQMHLDRLKQLETEPLPA